MRKFLFLFFSFILFLFFVIPVRADIYSYYFPVRFQCWPTVTGQTSVMVYNTSPVGSALIQIPKGVLSDGDLIYLNNARYGTTKSNIHYCFFSTSVDFINEFTSTSSYQIFSVSDLVLYISDTYTEDEVVDLTLDSYDSDLYYYISVGGADSYTDITACSVAIDKQAIEPTPSAAPSAAPSAVPSTAPTLEDYTFWTFCYDSYWKNGSVLSRSVINKFVPFSSTDFSSDKVGIYNHVFVYRVKIPFRVEATDFNGVGYFDASYKFDLDYDIAGLPTDNVNSMVDVSTPWIESVDTGMSFNATASTAYGYGFDVFNMSLNNSTSAEFYYCFDLYVSLYSNGLFTNFADYVDVTISNVSFDITSSTMVSAVPSEDILQSINQGIQDGNAQDREFHDEEVDKANEASDNFTSGVSSATDTLSSWEIITMPVTLVTDFVGVLNSDGNTGFTFPSFSLMGQELWPSYTFDLSIIAEKFPVLVNALHLISGILIVIAFIRYCWRKWAILTGDDMPEGESR